MHLVQCCRDIFANTHSKLMYQVQPSLPHPGHWFERLLTWFGHAMDLNLTCEHEAHWLRITAFSSPKPMRCYREPRALELPDIEKSYK